MEITEVRIKLMEDDQDRLLGFCSITIDGAFVVRDLKIIRGSKGPFVAMPSRKLSDRCPKCGGKNHLRAAYCGQCGGRLSDDRSLKTNDGKAKLYADIAHPINSDCRDLIQSNVLVAYEQEIILAKDPEYICRYDDYGEFDFADDEMAVMASGKTLPEHRSRLQRVDPPQTNHEPAPHRPHRAATAAAPEETFGDGVF